jgi:hypothetical protein
LNPVTIKGISECQVQVLIESELGNFQVITDKDGIFEKDINLQEGLNQIKIKAKDQAGNESEQAIINLVLDTQAPIVNFESLPDFQTNIYFVLSWSGSDNATTSSADGIIDFLLQYTTTPSDIDGVKLFYQNEQETWKDWKAGETLETKLTSLNLQGEDKYTYNFKIKARDQAGNESDWQYFSTRISLLEPILITEVQIEGEKIDNDFIELYNPNELDVDIGGYKLRKRNSTGSESSVCVFPDGSIIKAKGYFLWANSKDDFNIIIGADIGRTATLAGNNSIALFSPEDEILDALAWGESNSPFLEGTAFLKNPGANESLSRKWDDTLQNYQDTNNNLEDFQIQNSSPKKQNG